MSYRRKGLASLPITIFFVALIAIAFVGINAVASGQSGLANKQVYVENMLATRQQEMRGLLAFSSGNGMLLLTQSFGVTTNIVYVIMQTNNGQSASVPVNYVVSPGQTLTVNLTSLVQQMFNGNVPSGLSNITLVTSRGIYITSNVQTVQQSQQVTTYQQQQVNQTVQLFAGYNVTELNGTYSCPNGGSSCVYSATWNPGYYSCPSEWTLASSQQTCYQVVTTVVNASSYWGYWTTKTQSVWVTGYWDYYIVPVTQTVYNELICTILVPTFGCYVKQVTSCDPFTLCWPAAPQQAGIVPYYDELICTVLLPTSGCYIKQVTSCDPFALCWPAGIEEKLVIVPYYVSGYWTTQTQSVWIPGIQEFASQTYTMGAIWHPGYYSCSNGGYFNGTACISSSAQFQISSVLGLESSCPSGSQYICTPVFQPYNYTVTETTPVTETVYTTVIQTVSPWLIGG